MLIPEFSMQESTCKCQFHEVVRFARAKYEPGSDEWKLAGEVIHDVYWSTHCARCGDGIPFTTVEMDVCEPCRLLILHDFPEVNPYRSS